MILAISIAAYFETRKRSKHSSVVGCLLTYYEIRPGPQVEGAVLATYYDIEDDYSLL